MAISIPIHMTSPMPTDSALNHAPSNAPYLKASNKAETRKSEALRAELLTNKALMNQAYLKTEAVEKQMQAFNIPAGHSRPLDIALSLRAHCTTAARSPHRHRTATCHMVCA